MNTAIVAIFRDESRYIDEWVKYHLNLGFTHIYLYDNNDEPGSYVSDDERVSVRDCTGFKDNFIGYQRQLYASSYAELSKSYDWIAFIDLDEFITVEYPTIDAYLETVKHADVIHLRWKCFGDSGELEYNAGNVTDRFTEEVNPLATYYGFPANGFIKSMVRGGHEAVDFINTHCAVVPNGMYCDGDLRSCGFDEMLTKSGTYKYGYIRHYITKSLEEYVERHITGPKVNRKNIDWNKMNSYFQLNRLTPEKFEKMNRMLAEACLPTIPSIPFHPTGAWNWPA